MPETEDPTTEPTTDPEGQEPPETTGDEPETTPPADPGTPDQVGGMSFEDLPEATQKEIKRLRAEAANSRTNARKQAADEARAAALAEAATERETAVAAARAEETARIAKALGLTPAEEAELTPEQVIERVTKERDEKAAQAEAHATAYAALALEVAVQDAANMHDAKADKLLDSRTFMKAVSALDPTADGYRVAVAEAVGKAVEADADLKATPKITPPAVSGGTTVAGTRTKRPEDMTIDELREAKFHKRS